MHVPSMFGTCINQHTKIYYVSLQLSVIHHAILEPVLPMIHAFAQRATMAVHALR